MIPLRHYLIVSFLLLVNAASWGSGVNVTPPKSCTPGGCGGEDEPGYCVSALNASLEWSVNLGWARYVKPPDLVPLSKVPNLKNGNLTSIEDFYRTMFKQGVLQRSQIKLEMSQPYINADTFHPSILFVDGEPDLATIKAPAANGFREYISMILTDDAFTYINILPSPESGWRLRVWKRNVAPSARISDLATFLTKPTITDVTYKRPNGATGNDTLQYIQKQTFGSSGSRVITCETVQQGTGNGGPPTSLVAKTFLGEGTSGTLLSEERLWFSERTNSGWDYTITRDVYTASVDDHGIIGPLSLTRRSLEDYNDYSTETLDANLPLPPGHLSAGGLQDSPLLKFVEGLGWVMPYKLVRRHPTGGLPGMKRLMSMTEAYGVAGQTPQVSTYTYFEDLTPPVTVAIFDILLVGGDLHPNAVKDLTGSTLHGRMKSSSKPDGSWTSAIHSNTPNSAVTTWAEGSGWRDTQVNGTGLQRSTVTTTRNDQIEVEEFIGTQRIAFSTRAHGGTSEIVAAATNWEGNIPHTTVTAYFAETPPSIAAGRIKWIENSDGTAATYTYANGSSVEDLVVTARTGAGSHTGITAGTEVVTTYSFGKVAIAQITKDIASNLVTERWDTDLSYNGGFDALGRPIKRIYNADVNDFDIRQYACCGLEYARERDGSSTTYFRDGLKRVYKMESRASANSPAVSTFTTVAGLTEEGYRSVGPSALLFLGSTSKSMDGQTTVTIGPSEKSNLVADRPVTTSVRTHSAFGDTLTTTYADNSTAITSYYVDGQLKSKSGTAVPDVNYNYATAITLGGEVLRLGVTEEITASGVTTFTQQDDLGRTVRTGLQGAGSFPMSVTDHEYYPTSAGAGARGRLKSVTDSDGVKVSYGYNSEGERTTTSRTIPLATGTATQVTTTSDDVVADATLHGVSLGISLRSTQSIASTGIARVTTSESFISRNGLSRGSRALNRTTLSVTTRPDSNGIATRTTTFPDGTKSRETRQHDLLTTAANLTTAGAVITSTAYTYDPLQRPLTQTDLRTGTTSYDLRNNTTGTLIPDGLADVTESGLPLAMRSPANHTTTMAYDIMGRQTSTTLPDNTVTYTAYHPTGLVKAQWGSQTYPTWNVYDEQNRMTQLHTWQVAPALDPASIPATPPAGSAVTTWSYGPATGRLDRKQYPDTKGTDYTYTSAGRLQTRVWSRLNAENLKLKTSYSYTHGLLTSTDYNDATPDVTISYEPLGRRKVISTSIAKSEFAYDPASLRLDTETISYNLDTVAGYEFSRVLDRKQDTLLRDTGFDLKDGTTVENQAIYTYSVTDGRMSTVRSGDIPAPANTFTYNYLTNSNLIERIIGPSHDVTNTWEPNRAVLDIKENKVGTNVISSYDYTVDAIGQRKKVILAGSMFPTYNWTMTRLDGQIISLTYAQQRGWNYDVMGNLTSQNGQVSIYDSSRLRNYTYDAVGNRKKSYDQVSVVPAQENYNANALNQYTSVPSATSLPSYDFDGNATAYPLPAAPSATNAITWDAENRMLSTTVGATATTYAYDAYSRRIGKMTGSNTILYLYDGWNCIAEYETSTGVPPVLKRTRLWGLDLSNTLQGAGGVGGLLSETINNQPSALNYFPTYDGNGNVSEYLGSNGTVAAHFEYDPFGNTVANTDTSNQFSYRFSTKPRDAETGLYYYGYRYYDPLTGRWPSRDPIEENGGNNLYGFVGNKSISSYDYLGLYEDEYGNDLAGPPCCKGKPGVEWVTDDADERCCKNELRPVELRLDTRGSVGHAFLNTPTKSQGHYPVGRVSMWDWLNNRKIPGGTFDNSNHSWDRKRTYSACPDSIVKLEKSMDDHATDDYGLSNNDARNCAGWTCDRLSDAGFIPPSGGGRMSPDSLAGLATGSGNPDAPPVQRNPDNPNGGDQDPDPGSEKFW